MLKKMLVIILILAGLVCGQVSTETARMALGQGDGNDKTFTFDFSIIDTSDIVVIKRTTTTGVEALQTETTHYVVTATNNDFSSGGTVTFVTAPAATERVLLIRDTPMTQTTDYDTVTIRATTHSDPDDKQARLIQEMAEELERCIKIPRTDIASDMATTLTTSVGRANSTLVFSNSGAITAGTSTLTGAVATAYMETLLDDGDAATARTTLETFGLNDNVTFGTIAGTTGTFSGLITANAGLTLGDDDDLIGSETSDIIINTNKFTVAGATGNTVVGGTFVSTGVAVLADASQLATAAAPTDPCDIVNKQYVDDTVSAMGSYSSGSVMSITWPLTITATGNNADIASTQANTDGFLICINRMTVGSNGRSRVDIYTDSSNPPTNIRGTAYTSEAAVDFPQGTVTIPVKKGEYFKATHVAISGTITTTSRIYNWMPSGV